MATSMIDPHRVQSADVPGNQSVDTQDQRGSDSEEDPPAPRSKLGVNKSTNFRSKTIRTGTVGRGDEDDSDFDL